MKTNKTVYVLGAGFSYPHAPCQNKILSEIFQHNISKSWNTNISKFEKGRKKINSYLKELFQTKNIDKINLEDILTILDKAILSNEHIRRYNIQKLREFRNDFIYCIAFIFDEKLKGDTHMFYKDLAKKIVLERNNSNIDEFSFISLNWDLLLDNQINHYSYETLAAVDYCTFTNEFKNSQFYGRVKYDPNFSDINLEPSGYKNIKLLKLHGSFNWLICKNCNRLFKTFDEKIILKASDFIKNSTCYYCEQNSLEPVIITPTLLKDFNNIHLKIIWHKARIELMEATRIVFVGYSFPLADFEFRYILKRCISKSAEIVLALKGDVEANNRYSNFFGNQIKRNDNYKVSSKEFFTKEFNLN